MGMRRERTKKIIQRGCGRRTTVVVAKGSTCAVDHQVLCKNSPVYYEYTFIHNPER
jgi:hypothetical protein